MSFAFTLEEHAGQVGDFATIYSFRKEGEDRTEIEKFWAKPNVQQAPDHDNLRERLYEDILEEWNFTHPNCFQGNDRWFRAEADATDPEDLHAEALCADIPAEDRAQLTKPYPRLRLYCFRIDRILIAGNGGVKNTDRVGDVGKQYDEEERKLKRALQDVRHVMERVHERLEWSDSLRLVDSGFLLEGDLHFDKPDLP